MVRAELLELEGESHLPVAELLKTQPLLAKSVKERLETLATGEVTLRLQASETRIS